MTKSKTLFFESEETRPQVNEYDLGLSQYEISGRRLHGLVPTSVPAVGEPRGGR